MNDSLESCVTAILWYLYRKADCPFGETLQGLQLWIQTAIVPPFEEMAVSGWCAASITCQHCAHQWAAAYPASATSLECPCCREHTAIES